MRKTLACDLLQVAADYPEGRARIVCESDRLRTSQDPCFGLAPVAALRKHLNRSDAQADTRCKPAPSH